MPWVSIFVVGVVVGEGWSDLTAFVMQDEFGKGVVESIAVKLTYVFRDWRNLSERPRSANIDQLIIPHAAQAVRPG